MQAQGKSRYICPMNELPGGQAGGAWKSSLLDDLVFIKKNGRYPMSRKTIPSAMLILAFLLFGLRMLWTSYLLNQRGNVAVAVLLGVTFAVVFGGALLTYLGSLRFRSIPTGQPLAANMRLTEGFLKSMQLNLYRHPQAPEVYQILSRPLGNSDQREVMIFIADDNRILINSHFINNKWTMSRGSKNSRMMAKQFGKWLETHMQSADSGITAVEKN